MMVPSNIKKYIVSLACLFILGVAAQAVRAQGVNVVTSFDKRTVDINDDIKMGVKIIGNAGSLQRPRIPKFDGFSTYYTGRSSHFSFVNGKSKQTIVFNYVLVPQKVGTFTIGPIEISVNNETYKTDPISIEVVSLNGQNARSQPAPHPSTQAQTPYTTPVKPPTKSAPVPETLPEQGRRDLFLTVTADKTEVYPNEQATITYTIYTYMNTRYEGFEEEPETTGFWVEDFPDPKDLNKEEVQIGTKRYAKAEIRKLALFPTKGGGTHTINPGVVKCSVQQAQKSNDVFDSFFDDRFFNNPFFSRRKTRLLTAPPVDITIKPFPKEGEPANFTGLSGDFKLSVSFDKKTVEQNQPVTLSIVIEGDGNIETIERPAITDTKQFKMYDSDAHTELFKGSGTVRGQKKFEVIFIPTESGQLDIPKISMSYFNPRTRKYVTLEKGPFPVNVTPSKGGETVIPFDATFSGGRAKEDVAFETRDIYYIKDSIQSTTARKKHLVVALAVLDILFTIIVIVLFFMKKTREKLDANISLKRRKEAYRHFKKQLRTLEKLKKHNDVLYFKEAVDSLNAYFADKFNLSPHGLTWDVVEEYLKQYSYAPDMIAQCSTFYDTCNIAIFAPTSVSANTYQEINESLLRIVTNIEKAKIRHE